MKFILLVLAFFCFSSFAPTRLKNFATPELLADEVFDAIKTQDKQRLVDLLVLADDMVETFDRMDVEESLKTELKEEFKAKFGKKNKSRKETLIRNYDYIIENIKQNNCVGKIELDTVIVKIRKFNKIPLEMGKIDILYKCNNVTDTINAQIMKSFSGWKIAEDLYVNKR